MKTLLLIDASALVYRFFHALPPLTDLNSEPIQAIYGLTNVLLKILREQKPDYAAAALDRPERTFRKEQFEKYKIHRPPAPNDLIAQIKKLPEVFSAFAIKTFEKPGFEADDVIGTLVERFSQEPDLKIVILSGDLDVLQLVENDKIVGEIIKTGVTETQIYDQEKVEERYGLKPIRLPDYKGLIGDASDNIPGIKGIGPKSAAEVLKEFGTLEEVFENLAIINPTIAKKLQGKKDDAVFYRALATIRKDVPVDLPSLENIKMNPPDKDRLRAYFEKLGFSSLIRRLEA